MSNEEKGLSRILQYFGFFALPDTSWKKPISYPLSFGDKENV